MGSLIYILNECAEWNGMRENDMKGTRCNYIDKR